MVQSDAVVDGAPVAHRETGGPEERFEPFAVTVVGQVVFGITVASFYALTALRGDYHKWNFTNGYVPGFSMGNTAVVMHVASAVIIMLAGAVQLVPQIRNRFPVFHRWNGRMYGGGGYPHSSWLVISE